MAIEPVQHVTLLSPRNSVADLTDWLQKLAVIHVEDASGLIEKESEDSAAGFEKPAAPTEEIDNHIRELKHTRDVFDSFEALDSSLIEMIVALPGRVTVDEREKVISEFDYKPVYKKACQLDEEHKEHLNAINAAKEEYKQLEFFRLLPFEPEDLHSLKNVNVWVGTIMDDKWEELKASQEAPDTLALSELRRVKRNVDVCVVALKEDAEEAGRLLRSYALSEMPVPDYEGTRKERMEALQGEIELHHKEDLRCKEEVQKLSDNIRSIDILLSYWEAEQAKLQAQNSTVNSDRVAIMTGYIRQRDRHSFSQELVDKFPSVSDIYRAPTPDDDVPVEITNAEYLKPLRFLVDLFGRPDYFSFDPTPYLALSFLIFFGMCFGDLVYGIALAGLGYFLARKARPYEGLYKLCMMFCYAGIFTAIIGLLMGSWASDLPEYFGEDSAIYRLQQFFAVVSPIDQAVLLLVVSIGIGVINQFYGIALKAYGLIRKGKVMDAVYDAGLWYIVLPGFLIVSSSLFFDMAPWMLRLGFMMLIAGGIGLILTQGRDAEGLPAKFGAGLISIYGIMGSYGCVSFLSDILSYSRLIALGLTTSIVGLAVNIIAELMKDEIPVVGIALFVVVLIVGHTFNFMVSMLAAFVHPARLIFLEFFNRFYEGGGIEFKPLSLNTDSMIIEPGEVK